MASKIAIIGAGPSGLTLANILSKSSSLSVTVFDLRSQPSQESLTYPSGSLDLHTESGLLALEKCGLLDQFKKLPSECSEEMIIGDKAGSVRYKDEGHGGERPEISRNALVSLLLSSLPTHLIRWETKVLSITQSSSQKWIVKFSGKGSEVEEEFDFVVGADGAWSRVRDALQGEVEKPFYSGISYITLTIPHLSTAFPHLVEMVGTGTSCLLGDGKMLMGHRGTLDSVRVYVMLSSPESYLQDTGLLELSGLKERLLATDLFGTWGENAKELIAVGCDALSSYPMEARPLYMLPIGHSWTHTPGLTLIGDAAHLMTPFAGEGVNVAMLDALELSQAIIQNEKGSTLDEAVKGFEEGMWKRMKPVEEETYENLKMLFEDEKAPEKFIQFMESHGPPPEE